MSPFVHPDAHTNIHMVYDSFFHYQSDELQILQVGSLRGEQLFGNEVSLVCWKSLYQTITKSVVSTATQPFITKSYCLTFSLSLRYYLAKAATSARERCGVWSHAPVRANAQRSAIRDNSRQLAPILILHQGRFQGVYSNPLTPTAFG